MPITPGTVDESTAGGGQPVQWTPVVNKDVEKRAKAAEQMAKKAELSTSDTKKVVEAAKTQGAGPSLAPGVQALIEQLGSAQAIKQIPQYVTSALGRPIQDGDLKSIRQHYNGMPGVTTKLKSDADTVSMLNQEDPALGTFIVSTAVAGAPHRSLTIPLGAGYGNRNVTVPIDALTAAEKNWEQAQGQLPMIYGMADRAGVKAPLLMAAMTGMGRVGADETKRSAWVVADGLRQTLQDFGGDETLALIAMKNRVIASKLMNGTTLSPEEQTEARQFLTDARYSAQSMADAGVAINTDVYARVLDRTGQGNGSTANLVKLPDPEQAKQAVETLFRAWFQQAPTDAQVQQFMGFVNNAFTQGQSATKGGGVLGSPGGSSFYPPDLQTEAVAFARKQPDYQQVFGNRPANMDETSYANQMGQATQSILGLDGAGAAGAIRTGMESGSTQTAIGAAAGSAGAFENSTFQERLAKAAKVVASMT